jgi:hypothetical protein
MGLALGIGAATAYWYWATPFAAVIGLILSIGWLIADGLDGMVARATKTASAVGRLLDGICDHGVFILIYVMIATSIGTGEGWALALTAGAAHIIQSSLYEAERARFHRRLRGDSGESPPVRTGGLLERGYDAISRSIDRLADPFDRALRTARDPARFGAAYADRVVPVMKVMALESANMRVLAIFIACLAGNPRLFWWFEIVPLTILLIFTLIWHRRVEASLVRPGGATPMPT